MSAVPDFASSAELSFRLRQQELVAAFGIFALVPGSLQRLLDEVCRVAAEGLERSFAKVLRVRPETGDLLIVAGVGWHAGVVGHRALGGGMDSPAGFALHTGQPTLSNHLGRESRFRFPSVLVEHGIQSAINVVIGLPEKEPFGVLEVDSTSRNDFVVADTAFLQGLTNVLAAGLARIEGEEIKDALLRDKDMLAREVHHRVANSLQLVRTMLGLQGRTASQDARDQLDKAAGRIMSIAAVHRRLYQGGSVQEADAAEFLKALLGDMQAVMEPDRPIELKADTILLSADALSPLGLIVSELVMNAVKYGKGPIGVALTAGTQDMTVAVTDDGPGFKDAAMTKGLGMRLISQLAKGGGVEIDRTASFGRVVVRLKR